MSDDTNWFTDDRATLGDRIAAAREAAGLSQGALATRLGVRARTLEGWERDSTEPRANRLQMLAAMLGVSLRWLMSGEGDGPRTGPRPDGGAGRPSEALEELRRLRAQLEATGKGLERLENRLRMLQEPDDDGK